MLFILVGVREYGINVTHLSWKKEVRDKRYSS